LSGSEFGLSGSIVLYWYAAQLVEYNNSPFAIYRRLSPQANRFDGKSDGKSFFAILFLIFTVKPDLKLLEKPANKGIFRAPNRRAGQFIGFFAESHGDCARLIRCLHTFQQNAITQPPRVVACRLPKFVRALRGFLSLAVTGRGILPCGGIRPPNSPTAVVRYAAKRTSKIKEADICAYSALIRHSATHSDLKTTADSGAKAARGFGRNQPVGRSVPELQRLLSRLVRDGDRRLLAIVHIQLFG
jgi:hypothetical protein